jgi:hypothetical protein
MSPGRKQRGCMDQDANHATDERAIDTDVLQVATNLRFNLPADFLCIPAFHNLGDQRRDLAPIAHNQRVGEVQLPRVQLMLNRRLPPQALA